MQVQRLFLLFLLLAEACFLSRPVTAASDMTNVIKRVKPSIVGVGVFDPLARPPNSLMGTGFIVADGLHAVTNLHVVEDKVRPGSRPKLAIFVGVGTNVHARKATIVQRDPEHDVAVLKFSGTPLPTLPLNGTEVVEEGRQVAFTGFPIGAIYGLHPVTHRGMISAVTPIAIPQVSPRNLDTNMIERLKSPFNVFQLDATAYPGNSGSPVYDPRSGKVLAIISSVFVKETKESILQDPSGITFAVPIQYALRLLRKLDLTQAAASPSKD